MALTMYCFTLILMISYTLQFDFLQKQITKNVFGGIEITEQKENELQKKVILPNKSFKRDKLQQAELLKEIYSLSEDEIEEIKGPNMYSCYNRTPDETVMGEFFPILISDLKVGEQFTYHDGYCFTQISLHYDLVYDTNNAASINFVITTKKAKSLFCKEILLIGNTEFVTLEVIFFSGNHIIQYTNMNELAVKDTLQNGFKVFLFCDANIKTFIQVIKFFMVYFEYWDGDEKTNQNTPDNYIDYVNLRFLGEMMNYTMDYRETQFVYLNESYIKSGDMFAIMRLNCLGPLIMYGTGSHASHTAMALWDGDELYVVESTDGSNWPKQNIQKNKYSDWISLCAMSDFYVSHFPLKEDYQSLFNETAAWEFFNETEGDPYGYYNFIFGWIDTSYDNLPPIFPAYFLSIAISVLESLDPDTVNHVYTQAMNHRLETNNLNVSELAVAAAERNMTLEDVQAIPEQDGWLYYGVQDRNTTSYVCSSYVSAMYSVAGIYGDLNITATEQTPRDVYLMSIFDTEWERPQDCIDADPDLPFCQLLGKYRMTFPDYSTIDPYDHYGESCPTMPPEYNRPEDC